MATKTTRLVVAAGSTATARPGLPKGASVKKVGNALRVTLPVDFRPSSSGKSNLIASVGRYAKTGVKIDGNEVLIQVNVSTHQQEWDGGASIEFDVPLFEARPSNSGKMMLCGGLQGKTEDGAVRFSVNAGWYAPKA